MNLVFIHLITKVNYLGRVPLRNDRSNSEEDALEYGIRNGFFKVDELNLGKAYTTPKGEAYCEALKLVKEPTPSWSVQP